MDGILCTECSLPVTPDDDVHIWPEYDDGSPWHGFHYHEDCYEEGR